MPAGAAEGVNDFARRGYGRSCPRVAPRHYHVVVLSPDIRLDLGAGAARPDLESRMRGHVLGRGSWSRPTSVADQAEGAAAVGCH